MVTSYDRVRAEAMKSPEPEDNTKTNIFALALPSTPFTISMSIGGSGAGKTPTRRDVRFSFGPWNDDLEPEFGIAARSEGG